jgi:hypothetical protein
MRSVLLVLLVTTFAHADEGKRGGTRGRQGGVTVAMGKPTVIGELALDILRRYIYRNRARFQYCYENALRTKPTLAGIVTTKFEIGGDGIVTTSSASGVDPEISDCFAFVVKRIEFPKPRNEKSVTVTFPFVLRP